MTSATRWWVPENIFLAFLFPSTDYFWKRARLPIPPAEKAASTESRLHGRSGWVLTWLIQPFVALYTAYYVYLGLCNVFLFKDHHTFQSFIGFTVTLPIGKITRRVIS